MEASTEVLILKYGLVLGLLAIGYFFRFLVEYWRKERARLAYLNNFPRIVPAKDSLQCKKPHEWVNIPITVDGQVVGEQICWNCGLIAGSNCQVNPKKINKLHKYLEIAEAQQKVSEKAYGYIDSQLNLAFNNFIKESNIPDSEISFLRQVFYLGIETYKLTNQQLNSKISKWSQEEAEKIEGKKVVDN